MGTLIKYGSGSGHEFGLEIDLSDLPPQDEILKKMSLPVVGVHRLAKRFPPEQIAKALRNEPFEDYLRAVYASQLACDAGGELRDRFDQSYVQAAEDFLRRTFHSLTFIPGISFDIRNVSLEDERQTVDAARSGSVPKVDISGYKVKPANSLEIIYPNSEYHPLE